jgi:hypothetical protein
MAKTPPIVVYCQACDAGFGSTGTPPRLCPRCDQVPDWTRTPPFKLTVLDKKFMRTLRIAVE